MRILFYTAVDGRCKDLEALSAALLRHGHQVLLLSQIEAPTSFNALESIGVSCSASPTSGLKGLRKKLLQSLHLVKYCQRNSVDIVFAQLEPANLIACVSQYFLRARVVLVRHHVDEVSLSSTRRAVFESRLIYKLANKVIVVSERARQYMVDIERIQEDKIHVIPLGYDSSMLKRHGFPRTKRDGSSYRKELRLISACRLVKDKRVDLSIILLKLLRDKGISATLRILGKGGYQGDLEKLVATLKLGDFVTFVGYVSNVSEILSESDLLVHFSLIDSSPAIIRESFLAGCPVLACRGVGDIDEIVRHKVNGLLVQREEPLRTIDQVLSDFIKNTRIFDDGVSTTAIYIANKFDINNTVCEYISLAKSILDRPRHTAHGPDIRR